MYPNSMYSPSPWPTSRSRTLTSGERERRLKRPVRIKVIHGRKSHIFNTRLGRELAVVLDSCRDELLDRDEHGAELSLSLEVGRRRDGTRCGWCGRIGFESGSLISPASMGRAAGCLDEVFVAVLG